MRCKDDPSPEHNPPGAAEKVMHCNFRVGDAQVMASYGNCSGKPGFQGFALTRNARDEAEARRLFAALADGGPHYKLTPVFSLMVDCETQAEVDELWDKLQATLQMNKLDIERLQQARDRAQ